MPLGTNIFNIDYDEFFALLSGYSKKEVFIKDYGEEQKSFDNTKKYNL